MTYEWESMYDTASHHVNLSSYTMHASSFTYLPVLVNYTFSLKRGGAGDVIKAETCLPYFYLFSRYICHSCCTASLAIHFQNDLNETKTIK